MHSIAFAKMSGSRNDFILIDNRTRVVDEAELPRFITGICRRRISVGADGVILIEASATADFRWRFFNADGSIAEMCGNGARCAARFAVLQNLAGPRLTFETLAGLIAAEVTDHTVRVAMTGVGDFRLNLSIPLADGTLAGHFLRVGVPHVVVPVESLDKTPVTLWGREVRFHQMFQPAGTNVNFVRATGPHYLQKKIEILF